MSTELDSNHTNGTPVRDVSVPSTLEPAVAPEPPASPAPAKPHSEVDRPLRRWSIRSAIAIAAGLVAVVGVLWTLMGVPRAREFAGIAAQDSSTNVEVDRGDEEAGAAEPGGGEGEIILLFASISLAVVVIGAIVTAASTDVVQEAEEDLREQVADAEELHELDQEELERAQVAFERVHSELDRLPQMMQNDITIQEEAFWAGWHRRAMQRRDLHGGWETLEARRQAAEQEFHELYGEHGVPSAEEFAAIIDATRAAAIRRSRIVETPLGKALLAELEGAKERA